MEIENLEEANIYHFEFGGNTEVVGMIKDVQSTEINFFFHLHYWNGFETFHRGGYSLKSPITAIRKASKSEKHSLLFKAIESEII